MTDTAPTSPLSVIHIMAGAQSGGAEMAYIDMCKAMHEQGTKVTAICRKNPERNDILRKEGITVHELPFGGVFDLWTSLRLRAYIKHIKPDIVQSWMSRASQKLPRKPKTGKTLKYVGRLGGYYNVKKYFKRCDIFVGCTPDLCQHIIAEGIDEDNVTQINNFAETESEIAPIDRASLDTTSDQFVFLTLARLHEAKAIDTLLNSFEKLPDTAMLWIAGAGPDEEKLKQQCTALGLDKRVRFLGWRTDRGALLGACDAVVFPSRHEPFGSTFVQAWAAQKPLVTTASQGPKQYVIPEQDALLVDIDDVDGLATSMQRVMEDKDLCKQLVKNAYQRYRNEFEKSMIVQKYLDFYRLKLNPED